jgi:hypothetical protein
MLSQIAVFGTLLVEKIFSRELKLGSPRVQDRGLWYCEGWAAKARLKSRWSIAEE